MESTSSKTKLTGSSVTKVASEPSIAAVNTKSKIHRKKRKISTGIRRSKTIKMPKTNSRKSKTLAKKLKTNVPATKSNPIRSLKKTTGVRRSNRIRQIKNQLKPNAGNVTGVKVLSHTAILARGLHIAEPTPNETDTYKTGEAEMREPSPIRKLRSFKIKSDKHCAIEGDGEMSKKFSPDNAAKRTATELEAAAPPTRVHLVSGDERSRQRELAALPKPGNVTGVKVLSHTAILARGLHIAEPTPNETDTYKTGEAEMREPSPIRKLRSFKIKSDKHCATEGDGEMSKKFSPDNAAKRTATELEAAAPPTRVHLVSGDERSRQRELAALPKPGNVTGVKVLSHTAILARGLHIAEPTPNETDTYKTGEAEMREPSPIRKLRSFKIKSDKHCATEGDGEMSKKFSPDNAAKRTATELEAAAPPTRVHLVSGDERSRQRELAALPKPGNVTGVKVLSHTAILARGLHIAEPTPNETDTYKIGEAEMREPSPIRKLRSFKIKSDKHCATEGDGEMSKKFSPDNAAKRTATELEAAAPPTRVHLVSGDERSRQRELAALPIPGGSQSGLDKTLDILNVPVTRSNPIGSLSSNNNKTKRNRSKSTGIRTRKNLIKNQPKPNTGNITGLKILSNTAILARGLHIAEPTPEGEDPYELGEAQMREPSPIPKLNIRRTMSLSSKPTSSSNKRNTLSQHATDDEKEITMASHDNAAKSSVAELKAAGARNEHFYSGDERLASSSALHADLSLQLSEFPVLSDRVPVPLVEAPCEIGEAEMRDPSPVPEFQTTSPESALPGYSKNISEKLSVSFSAGGGEGDANLEHMNYKEHNNNSNEFIDLTKYNFEKDINFPIDINKLDFSELFESDNTNSSSGTELEVKKDEQTKRV